MEELISANGYAIINLNCLEQILEMQEIVTRIFSCSPVEIHKKNICQDDYLLLTKKAKDEIAEKKIVKKILLSNLQSIVSLFGPDIDVQSKILLRISRPNNESDFVDWHRDTFYGNSYSEFNIWFPIFPLEEGSGLMVIEGSHLIPSTNIRPANEKDPFRRQVVRGSIANELGYIYEPKIDDTIAKRSAKNIKLLSPSLGQAIFFFGYMAHKGQNLSSKTRISADFRIKSMSAATNTKPGYYEPLQRGAISKCVEKMISINDHSN